MTPDQYCQQQAAASGSSFYYSFRFLDAPRRRAITALYAFCREVDDVVDECADAGVARMKLTWWRGEVAALYGGHPSHPVTQALAPALSRFDLRQELMLEIIAGMAMDLDQARYPDFAALERYCYRVASAVGLLAARIFGHEDPGTLDYAHDLGLALQLTNIIRDVGEDARRGRIYIPQDELEQFGVPEGEILQGQTSSRFVALMAFQAERARQYYARALARLPAVDRRRQRPGLIMAAIYRAILEEIAADGYRVLDRRLSLPALRKLWIAIHTWLWP